MRRPGRVAAQGGLWVLRLSLSGLFIYAGALKVRDPRSFADSVASFRLLPTLLVNPVALGLPVLEVLAGAMALGYGRWRRLGAFALLTLLIVFIIALVAAWTRGLNVDCGCFGARELDVLAPTRNPWAAILRDTALTVIASTLYVIAGSRYAKQGVSRDDATG